MDRFPPATEFSMDQQVVLTEAADLPRNGRAGAGHLDQQFAHLCADGLQDGPGGTQPPGRFSSRDDPGTKSR